MGGGGGDVSRDQLGPLTECGEVSLAPEAESDHGGVCRWEGQDLLQSKIQHQASTCLLMCCTLFKSTAPMHK